MDSDGALAVCGAASGLAAGSHPSTENEGSRAALFNQRRAFMGEVREEIARPSNDWISKQAALLCSTGDQDAVGALAWNLTVAFRRWSDEQAAALPSQGSRVETLEAALKPFAAKLADIGADEADDDTWREMSPQHRRAPAITVGDMRRAAAALPQQHGD